MRVCIQHGKRCRMIEGKEQSQAHVRRGGDTHVQQCTSSGLAERITGSSPDQEVHVANSSRFDSWHMGEQGQPSGKGHGKPV